MKKVISQKYPNLNHSQSQEDPDNQMTREQKIKIVIEAINSGNLSKVAASYGKPESTVRSWNSRYYSEIRQILADQEIKINEKRKRVARPKFMKMEKLLLQEILKRRSDKLAIGMREI
jgi:hypothetical protein